MTGGIVHVVYSQMRAVANDQMDFKTAIAHAHASVCNDLARQLAGFCENKHLTVYTISSPGIVISDDMVLGSLSACLYPQQVSVPSAAVIQQTLDNVIDNVDRLNGAIHVQGNQVVDDEMLAAVLGDGASFADIENLRRAVEQVVAGSSVTRTQGQSPEEARFRTGTRIPEDEGRPAATVLPGNGQPRPAPNMSGVL